MNSETTADINPAKVSKIYNVGTCYLLQVRCIMLLMNLKEKHRPPIKKRSTHIITKVQSTLFSKLQSITSLTLK